MQKIITLSAYETSAETFFSCLERYEVGLLLDVRLHNTNQLAGFTKRRDLEYFCRAIAKCDYAWDADFSPDEELLKPYLHHEIDFDEFQSGYRALMASRDGVALFERRYGSYGSVALLGTSTAKRHSHAEVLAHLLAEKDPDAQVVNFLPREIGE